MKKSYLVLIIIFCHFLLLFLFDQKEPPKKKLLVTEYRLKQKKVPKRKKITAPVKKTKKTARKRAPTKKKSFVASKKKAKTAKEIAKMLDSWNTIFDAPSFQPTEDSSGLPATISLDLFSYVPDDHYADGLVSYLKKEISLPEKGSIKVKIVLRCDGSLKHYSIVSTDNERNATYLKKHLPTLTFPCFNKKSKEKEFSLHFTGT